MTSPDTIKNTIQITPAAPYTAMEIKILTPDDLANGMSDLHISGGWDFSWTGPTYNASNPMAFNELINHTEGRSSFFSEDNPFMSGYVDLQPIKKHLHI